ncbi:short-chain dehydrogenase [Coniochaeta sp. 2T2.1]|nr:short-chain dehydrogenase [Coniochaeta sp. 2T2.1]
MSICPKAIRGLARSRPSASLPILRTAYSSRSLAARSIHSSASSPMQATPQQQNASPAKGLPPKDISSPDRKRFADFEIAGKVFIVTGGARGLGLTLAEGLAEAGGKVYCLDRQPEPDDHFAEAKSRLVPEWGGELHYRQQDITDTKHLDELVTQIAEENRRLDGVIAAAGVQKVQPAIDWTPEEVEQMFKVNYTGLFMTATSAARQMFRFKNRGSICFIASMSGQVANKGLLCPVYNSSKAAVVQLARNLAMEWSKVKEDGTGGIRINCISPGHIVTPMVLKNFEEVPGLKEKWEAENMMGRLSSPDEFKGAAIYLLSNASSFMTGSNIVIDGGHTAW